MSNSYDVIVAGLGAMGSATAYQLAKRGQRVLGLEMFEPGHDKGSSHGYHRMIRKAMIHDDGYTPLAERAFELWDELGEESGRTLLTIVGEVHLVHRDYHPNYEANAQEMQRRGVWEILDERDLAERFPGFRLYDNMLATYEAQAGFLWSEEGIRAHLDVAARRGATIQFPEEVVGYAVDGDGVRVDTNRGSYTAGRLVITTGSYAAELLKDLKYPLDVIRTVNGYFQPERPDWWTVVNGAPDFLFTLPEGQFYGMPAMDGIGLKIGMSRLKGGPATTARTIRRTIDEAEIDNLRIVLDKYMPGAAGAEMKRITCMCTYTPDDGFIIDHHPEHEQVLFGCGFSGRGYKFAPTVGEILADLALDDATRHDIAFMSAARFARD